MKQKDFLIQIIEEALEKAEGEWQNKDSMEETEPATGESGTEETQPDEETEPEGENEPSEESELDKETELTEESEPDEETQPEEENKAEEPTEW